ncbi:MAG: glycosyl hydrolase family 98 [Bacteroidaceae bacterium]|nr:glycosyl hydrolase family 98 [Bacteroidaceae bacterium]
MIRRFYSFLIFLLLMCVAGNEVSAQQRRPIDNENPLWLIHVDVWNKADPQKIIDLIPDDIKPYVCLNLSLSCQYDTEKDVYKMPQNAIRTYKSWATVCQLNNMWFTCQPASGGHTHIQDDDIEIFEYFYKRYPNFLGWNYCEQFWGFDEPNDESSSSQADRLALFAKLVPMAHKYGGFLTISFCGNIWSHGLNPVGMMKRNKDLLKACQDYPEACLWLYKYTTSSCFYNNESVTISPFISGLATNYGVRYDNCGWNGALDAILGEGHGKKYPTAAGIGTVMEQTCVNGGAVWDGPELIWTEDFQNLSNTTVDGYSRRNWGTFPSFRGGWIDMFRKIIDGTMRIPSRKEVVENTKIVVVNDINNSDYEQSYAAWGDLYDGLYKQNDPFNKGNGQWMDNYCYFKKTGRYAAIPVVIDLYDSVAKAIPAQVKKSVYKTRWSSQTAKVNEFNKRYPEVSTGDLYVSRRGNQLITYTPYTYLNKKKTASAEIPLLYNRCDTLELNYGKLSSGTIREYKDSIVFYLNNYRSDSSALQTDYITIRGAESEPTYTVKKRLLTSNITATPEWDETNKIFKLTLKHLGAVDLVINTPGEAEPEGKLADAIAITPLGIPQQPADYKGEIIIEAEDMDYRYIKSCVTDPYGQYPSVRGHAGNGFMDMGTNTSGSLRHQLNSKVSGAHTITVRYTSPSKAGKISITVNGTKKNVDCEKTATNEWRKVSVSGTINEGKNNLIIMNTGGASMYIDQIIYTPEGVEEEKFSVTMRESESGEAVADVTEAVEGQVVKLTVTPKEGFAHVGWDIIHGNVTIGDDNTFVMPDDIVTLQPLFVDQSSVYTLDYTNVLNGAIPEGWRTVDGETIHDYPNSYGSGARTFVGFTGYQGKALYWRVTRAEYGMQSAYPLTLQAGTYKLTFAMAAWKGTPKYKVSIINKSTGKAVVTSSVLSATPNADGNSGANLTSAKQYTLDFTINDPGNYVIRFLNNGTGYDEFLLLECRINVKTLSIDDVLTESVGIAEIYDVNGIRRESLQPGLNIIVTTDGKVRKLMIKK